MPGTELEARRTKQWQDIGFQGKDPATDFRGMGVLGLYCLQYPLLCLSLCVCVCVCVCVCGILLYFHSLLHSVCLCMCEMWFLWVCVCVYWFDCCCFWKRK